MINIAAVDPGDKHVGVSIWKQPNDFASKEYEADVALVILSSIIPVVDALIIEEFTLYPGSARSLVGTKMETAEMIGALRWIASQFDTEVVLQPASIKIPTMLQCRARGIDYKETSIHAQDAKLHLIHYLLRNGLLK